MIHASHTRRRAGALAALLLVWCATIGLGAGGQRAFADSGQVTYGVQPAAATGPDNRGRFDYNVAPGTVISDWVSVTNSSSREVTLRIVAEDATTDYDTGSFTLVGTDVASTDAGSWISVNHAPSSCTAPTPAQVTACLPSLGTNVKLAPGERATIPFTLTVPHDATPGDHAAGIAAVYTTTQTNANGISTPLEVHAATRVYLRVDGPVSPGMLVSGLVSGYSGGWNPLGGTARVGFDLVNAGNSRVSASTTVSLSGPFGIGRRSWQLPDAKNPKNLMPGKSTHIASELSGVPAWLLLFADVTVTPVAADGAPASDPLPRPVKVSSMAWAVSWSAIGLIVVAAGVVVLVWWRRREHRLINEALHAMAAGGPDGSTAAGPGGGVAAPGVSKRSEP